MNILLTGSSGFIGSYFQDNYNKENKISTFSFQNDRLDKLDLIDIDTIIHLSALVHQMGGASKEAYWKINVDNTLELAQKAKKHGVKHFIFISSVKVYGEETDTPYNETTKCTPQDDYGKSKLEAENKLLELEDNAPKGISVGYFKVSIIRTPIVYGYGVKANIKNLINLIKKAPVLPFSQINNSRSMVYIGNLCALIDKLCKIKTSGIFLAADDHAVSTSKLIELIASDLHKNIYLIKIPFFESLLKMLKPSVHKRLYESLEINNDITKKILNHKNPYSTEDGIKYMIHGENR